MDSEIWVLGDYRPGTTNQAIALAKELKLSFELKNIEYNIFGKLPNLLLQIYPIHIKQNILQSLGCSNPPKIIISSGRRTAPLALYLKRKFDNKPKVIQIMKPNIAHAEFDLIILPKHDVVVEESPNIVRIIGALSSVDLEKGREELNKNYPSAKKFIGVIIGGDSKNYKFDEYSCIAFVSILSTLITNHSLPFFISFSRRTPDFMKQIIQDNFSSPHIIYDPKNGGSNPYLGILASGGYIISTADSISMCSEAAYSGKPLYIFYQDDFALKKHRSFIEELIKLGIAKRLDRSVSHLEEYTYKPLNETKRIAEIIKDRLF